MLSIGTLLGTEPHAVGQASAADRFARKLQDKIEAYVEVASLQLDATNALSCITRQATLEELAGCVLSLAHVVVLWRTRPSTGVNYIGAGIHVTYLNFGGVSQCACVSSVVACVCLRLEDAQTSLHRARWRRVLLRYSASSIWMT